jgi:hypothetical protein
MMRMLFLNLIILEQSNDDNSSSSSSSPPGTQFSPRSLSHKRFASSGQYMTLFSAYRPDMNVISDSSINLTGNSHTARPSHQRSKSLSMNHMPLYDPLKVDGHLVQPTSSDIDGISMVWI